LDHHSATSIVGISHIEVTLIMNNKSWKYMIIGLGATGVSCARYLTLKQETFALMDSRNTPPNIDNVRKEFPDAPCFLGGLDEKVMCNAETLIVSPGIPLYEPSIHHAIKQGCSISSDIELFCENVAKPIVAVTGSNGKSTVVSLMGKVAELDGKRVPVIGNIGEPVLSCLYHEIISNKESDAYILELSSFQLERLNNASFVCAAVLNVSPDHMDRYEQWDDYITAKQKIYSFAQYCVVNSDDPLTHVHDKSLDVDVIEYSFKPQANGSAQFKLVNDDQKTFIVNEDVHVVDVDKIKLFGLHNVANVLVVTAFASVMNWKKESLVQGVATFSGLEHRCQYIGSVEGITFVNDSKGTNVGATDAAIKGLGQSDSGNAKNIILIAGGVGKNGDFSKLAPVVGRCCKGAVLIGEDALKLRDSLEKDVVCYVVESMSDAVTRAYSLGNKGDVVLLSPACASFDMFDNYEHRGHVFTKCVAELEAEVMKC
jgi:UDP-N-acetylmuramoylalanine--D-glutamate ligase